MWGKAKKVLGMYRDKAPTTVISEEGDLISNPQELADTFNDFSH